jgi:hypothetical protein
MNLKDLSIAISSYKTSYQVCAKKLIDSLVNDNAFSRDQILLVIGGFDTKESFTFMGCSAIKVNHNSYDHTALIEIIEGNHQSTYWFLTHDTCIAGPKFSKYLKSFIIQKHYTAMTDMGWLNMGVLNQNFIKTNSNFIMSLKNCSKIRAILSERTFTRLGDFDYLVANHKSHRFIETQNIYGDDKQRTVLYFNDLDFYKYQSYEALNVMKPNFTENSVEELF